MRTPIYRCELVREGTQAHTPSTCDSALKAAALFREFIGDSDREHFVMAAVSARLQVIGLSLVSLGTVTASLVHPREVFKPAILLNASGILVCHNHPSGDATPSAEDRDATRRLVRAGELLGVPLNDHIILGAPDWEGKGYYSFRETGML